MEKSIVRINDSIMNSKIGNSTKELMLEVVKGIVSSSVNKVFVKKSDDYQEYLTMRKPAGEEFLRILIVKKMIEYSGAVGGKDEYYPSIGEFANYVESNRDVIEASLNGIEYATSKVDLDSNTHYLIRKLSSMNLPDYMTSRTMQVLEKITNGERVYSVRENNHEEYIALDDDTIIIVEKMIDYAGSTAGKRRFTINLSDLLDYVEMNHATIDRSLSKGKRF